MLFHKTGAVCALAVVVHVFFEAATLPATAHAAVDERTPAKSRRVEEGGRSGGSGSSCSYDPNNNTCGTYPANLQECLEDCAYQHGRDIEACNRKKDKKKRPECYAKANEKHAQCKRDCEKKYKPKE